MRNLMIVVLAFASIGCTSSMAHTSRTTTLASVEHAPAAQAPSQGEITLGDIREACSRVTSTYTRTEVRGVRIHCAAFSD